MEEKRKLKRHHLIFNLEITDEKTGKVLGYLGDLNTEGLLILTNDPIPLNKHYRIYLALPKNNDFDKDKIPLGLKTLWRTKDENPEIMDTGCEFTDVAPKDYTIINELIEFLGFKDL